MSIKRERGSISIFVLVACLFMSAFLLISYTSNVGKSKVIEEQFNIIRGIYSFNNGDEGAYDKAYTDLRKKNKQTMTASVENSNSIELTKTFAEKLSNYRIYGNSVQDGIPTIENPVEIQSLGEKTVNLFDPIAWKTPITSAGITIQYLENEDCFLINGTAEGEIGSTTGKYFKIPIENNSYYSISSKYISGSVTRVNNNDWALFYFVKEDSTASNGLRNWYDINLNNMDTTKIGLLGDTDIMYSHFRINSGVSFNNYKVKIQLEKNMNATEYEPYGKYKVPVKVSGKNLFDINSIKNNTPTTVENNRITIKGGSGNPLGQTSNEYISVSAGESISISFKLIQGKARIGFILYDDTKELINNSTISISGFTYNMYYKGYWRDNTSGTFTVPEGVKYIKIFVVSMNNNGIDNIYEDYQVEKGSKVTQYENYKEEVFNIYLDEPLRKIGDYSDYIDFKNGEIVRYIKEKIFTGDDSRFTMWTTSVTDLTSGIYWANADELGIYKSPKFISSGSNGHICTHFVRTSSGVHTKNDDLLGKTFAAPESSPPYIAFKVPFLNVEDWRSFLRTQYNNGNPVKVQYVLVESIVDGITLPEIEASEDYTKIEILTDLNPSKIEINYEGYTLN